MPDTVKFCPKCGEKAEVTENLKDSILCPKCGTPNPSAAKFCRKDGAPLQKLPTLKEEIKHTEPKEDVKPEVVIEAKVSEAAPVMKQEEKPAGKMLETEKAKDVILCPKCGTPNLLTVKFCKKDGTPLKEEVKPHPAVKQEVKPETTAHPKIKEQIPSRIEVRKEATKGISKKHIWIVAAILVVIVAGVGSYLYFSGRPSEKPAEVATKLEVPKSPENLLPPGHETKIEEPAKPQSPPVETVSPPATPEPSKPPIDITRVERDLNRSLRNRGLNDVYAKVNKDLTATLAGTVNDPRDKMLASTISKSFKGIKNVNNEIIVAKLPPPVSPAPAPEVLAPSLTPISKIDPAKLEGDINRTLRNAGLSGVTAVVNDNLEVTLKGSVGSKYEKDRAFEIAKTFKEAKRIKDIIFVVEQ
jgi:predicted RNA-binding Zn-ribbon protein involved in translation (DUF1610 family)